MAKEYTGAEVLINVLLENGTDTIFGYPGGAVLPIYDELFKTKKLKHILVRHEQAAVHAAEGYARSTGKVGVVLVTSGPGATNAVTGITDALLDSIPLVCITGQVPTNLIGTDAFQEADTVGITRHCTKTNYLIKDVDEVSETIYEAFHVAKNGRPGPVVVDIPKDIQFAKTKNNIIKNYKNKKYNPLVKGNMNAIKRAVSLLINAKKPVIYGGGGLINSGGKSSKYLVKLIDTLNLPCTMTLMGLGAIDNDHPNYLGMVGMHGTFEANYAMHDCDVMLCLGARFDDRVTGRTDKFSPESKKIHVDIDRSSINKIINVDIGIIGDCESVLKDILFVVNENKKLINTAKTSKWWKAISKNREIKCLAYKQDDKVIKPQYAIETLYNKTKKLKQEVFVTTEVGQHQMWAAQYFKQHKEKRFMTSGGLGTMGYGFPAAVGVQVANPKDLVICIAGEASFLMNLQEMGTCAQYELPVKVFVINNQWMGMVRQWQELLHEERYSHTYTKGLPDFEKLSDAYGWKGIKVSDPLKLDEAINEMIEHKGPVIVDVRVSQKENCFPMIPSGKAHNEMILNSEDANITVEGKKLV